MDTNTTHFKCLINGKEAVLICDVTFSTTEAKEALFQFMKYIGQIEDAHAAKLKEEQDSKVIVMEDSKQEEIMVE